MAHEQYRYQKLNGDWSEWRDLNKIEKELKQSDFKEIKAFEVSQILTKEEILKDFSNANLQDQN